MLRLPADDFFGQEIHDIAVAAGKVTDEILRGRMAAQRQGGQVQPGRPPFGSFHEAGQGPLVKLDGSHLLDQRVCLVCGEVEIAHRDLGHLPRRSQPAQWQGRVGPGAQHDLGAGRETEQQKPELLMTAPLLDDVVVIKNDHDGRRE
jgi:hypothetical protein